MDTTTKPLVWPHWSAECPVLYSVGWHYQQVDLLFDQCPKHERDDRSKVLIAVQNTILWSGLCPLLISTGEESTTCIRPTKVRLTPVVMVNTFISRPDMGQVICYWTQYLGQLAGHGTGQLLLDSCGRITPRWLSHPSPVLVESDPGNPDRLTSDTVITWHCLQPDCKQPCVNSLGGVNNQDYHKY